MSDLTANLTEIKTNLKMLQENLDAFYLIMMSIVIFLMQCGFAFLEVGCVRSKNTINILIKNMFDCLIGALAFWATGYAISSSDGTNPVVGEGGYFGYKLDHIKYSGWFWEFTFATTSATIVSGSMAERTRFSAYIVYSFMFCAVIYPFVSHWAWNEHGWLKTFGYHDFAGSGVVHILGGTCAFVGCWLVGPRMGRYDELGRPPVQPGHSVPMQALGGFILFMGFLAFNGAGEVHISQKGDGGAMSVAVVNTLMGGSSAGVTSVVVSFLTGERTWSFTMLLNGALAGMVSMGAGSVHYEPWAAVIVGMIASQVYSGILKLMHRFRLDDPLDAVAVHVGGGVVGVLCEPFFHSKDGIFWTGNTLKPWKSLGAQCVGAIVIMVWSFVWGLLIFGILKFFKLLRVDQDSERRGLDIAMHGECAYPKEAWLEDQYQPISDFNVLPQVIGMSRTGGVHDL